jgi:hypothetical protein
MYSSGSQPVIVKTLIVLLGAIVASTARAQQVSPWPQRLDGPDGLITVYQPQPSKFEGNTLTARAAVSLTPPGATDPEFGAMWFTANVATDRDARVVTIQNVTIKQVKLPNATDDLEKKFGQVIEQRVPSMQLMLSLDQLESTLSVVQQEKAEAQKLYNTPPKIVFVTTPTTLVLLDGPPKLQATQTNGVMSVVNTPFIMLLEMASKKYYLKAGDTWMVAPDATGPWTTAGAQVPPDVLDAGAKLVAKGAPPQATPQPENPGQILVAEEPTEVISCQGEPTYAAIQGNDLLYMTNTGADVFLEVPTQNYFILLSGRWFVSKSLEAGPWTFVPADKLPPAFAQIPADSPKANVLASVAGTQQANDARMDARIPQTTAIQRSAGASETVEYDGSPQFAPVEGSNITYASNCDVPVLNVNNAYYCCDQAVWYQSAAPTGPWTVCDSVPQAIYTLPPSCPVYYCRYCYTYGGDANVVYCGYLPGYTGSYVYGPTVVYGTGYRYPFWYHDRFIAYPYTWGFGARYDYNAGSWGYGSNFQYGPAWFAHRQFRANWFGPQGYVDYHRVQARNVINSGVRNSDRSVITNRINLYNREENVRRNVVAHNTAPAREAPGNEAAHREAPAAANNVFVGQDGNVYRRTATGWETHDAKGWSAYKGETPSENHETKAAPADSEHHDDQARTPAVKETPHQEEPGREQPKVEQPHTEQPNTEQAHTEQPRGEQPRVEQPREEQPRVQQPSHSQPAPGGLENEYNARQRGSTPAPSSGGGHASGGGGGGGGASPANGGGARSSGGGGGAGNGGGAGGGGAGGRR